MLVRRPEGKRRSLVAATIAGCREGILQSMDVEMRHLRALLALADELNFTRAAERFHTRHPEVELTIHFGGFLDPLGGLRDGPADVAFLYGEFEHEGIELLPLFTEPRGVALAADHPLAARNEITIEEFIAEPLVEVPVRDGIWSDFWTAASHRNGAPPRIGASVSTLDGLMEA